ncbi:MAG: glycosyltransferase [Flavobacteriales bacterium]|nr:glycosyltransferase [Flavobacteriales bacterium]
MTSEYICLALFTLAAVIVAVNYVFMLVNIRKPKKGTVPEKKEGISVVVVARNQMDDLHRFIPSIIAQDYPRFELIVVDDRSFDNTMVFLKSIQRNYPSILKTACVNEDTPYPWPGRKFAITIGVKAAQYERIVLMEPTAVPQSQHWLSSLSIGFNNDDTRYVIGGCVRSGDKGLPAWFHSVMSFFYNLLSLSWAKIGQPYSATVSNFSFKKSCFLSENAYMDNMRIPSGEADFLLQKNGTFKNTAVVIDDDAFIKQTGICTWKNVFDEFTDMYASFRHYTLWAKTRVLSFLLSKLSFWIFAVCSALTFYAQWWFWAVLSVPLLLSVVAGGVCAHRMKVSMRMMIGMFLDVITLPLGLIVFIIIAIRMPKKWR